MEHDVTEFQSQIISSPKRSRSVLKDDFRCYEIIPTKESSNKDPPYKVFDLWPSGENDLQTVNLILLGETGKGKTSLINGMINHLLCVNLYHTFRMLAPVYCETPNKCDSDSQTEQITVYNLPYYHGMPYKCNFKLIDTPGMLDTRGSEVQSENRQRIKLFLEKYHQKESLQLGIVTEANLKHGKKVNDLVAELKNIMHARPKLKFISIATFADKSRPTCHSVLGKKNIPLSKQIKIDNSVIFSNPLSCKEYLIDPSWETWKKQITSLLNYLTHESYGTNWSKTSFITESSIRSSIRSSDSRKTSRLSSTSSMGPPFITAKTTFSIDELKPNLIHTKRQCDDLLKKIEGYEILDELGTGAYGVAKKAYNKDTKQTCVLKLLYKSVENSKEGKIAENEVKLLSSLRHPYVVQYLEHFVDSGQLIIAMEFCGGGTLRQLIQEQNGTKFEEEEILDMFGQMCLGLKYIHGKNILHRDLKPDNVFITDDQRIKLGDFGHAMKLAHSHSLANTFCGTELYMSPEIHKNSDYNDKNDIWALGCMLYEMAALKSAFKKVIDIQTCKYKPLVPSIYSPELKNLIGKLLQKDPDSRPSASAILIKPLMLARLSELITGCNEDVLSKLIESEHEQGKLQSALEEEKKKVPAFKCELNELQRALKDEKNIVSGYECDLKELKSTLEEEKKKVPVFKCELNKLRRALKEEKMKVQDEKKKVNKHQSALEEEKENVQDEKKKVEKLQRALKDEKKIVQNTDQQMAVPEASGHTGLPVGSEDCVGNPHNMDNDNMNTNIRHLEIQHLRGGQGTQSLKLANRRSTNAPNTMTQNVSDPAATENEFQHQIEHLQYLGSCKHFETKFPDHKGVRLFGYPYDTRIEEYTVLLVGAAKSGKSSLIDFIANFFMGSSPSKTGVFNVTSRTQDKQIICSYKFTTKHKITFTFIDSPSIDNEPGSIGKTRRKGFIAYINRMKKNGIRIDALGFVIQSHILRWKPAEKSMLKYVTTILGKENIHQIIPIFTYADANTPPALDDLHAVGINTLNYLVFQDIYNVCLNTRHTDITEENETHWEEGFENIKKGLQFVMELHRFNNKEKTSSKPAKREDFKKSFSLRFNKKNKAYDSSNSFESSAKPAKREDFKKSFSLRFNKKNKAYDSSNSFESSSKPAKGEDFKKSFSLRFNKKNKAYDSSNSFESSSKPAKRGDFKKLFSLRFNKKNKAYESSNSFDNKNDSFTHLELEPLINGQKTQSLKLPNKGSTTAPDPKAQNSSDQADNMNNINNNLETQPLRNGQWTQSLKLPNKGSTTALYSKAQNSSDQAGSSSKPANKGDFRKSISSSRTNKKNNALDSYKITNDGVSKSRTKLITKGLQDDDGANPMPQETFI